MLISFAALIFLSTLSLVFTEAAEPSPNFVIVDATVTSSSGYRGTKYGLAKGAPSYNYNITVRNVGSDAYNVEVRVYQESVKDYSYVRFDNWPSNETHNPGFLVRNNLAKLMFLVYADQSRTILQHNQTHVIKFNTILYVDCIPSSITPGQYENITITGSLTYTANKSGIPNQEISLYVWNGNWTLLSNVQTDQSGNYSYVWLPPTELFEAGPNQIVAEIKAQWQAKPYDPTTDNAYSSMGKTNIASGVRSRDEHNELLLLVNSPLYFYLPYVCTGIVIVLLFLVWKKMARQEETRNEVAAILSLIGGCFAWLGAAYGHFILILMASRGAIKWGFNGFTFTLPIGITLDIVGFACSFLIVFSSAMLYKYPRKNKILATIILIASLMSLINIPIPRANIFISIAVLLGIAGGYLGIKSAQGGA